MQSRTRVRKIGSQSIDSGSTGDMIEGGLVRIGAPFSEETRSGELLV